MPVIFLSEEQIKKLPQDLGSYDTIAEKKEEIIKNDPTKIVPKSVFNQKLEEIKLLQQQIKDTSSMVTSDKMKEELAIKEAEYKNELKKMQDEHKLEMEKKDKQTLLKDHLVNEKCTYPDLLLQQINLDEVIIKDGKILNMDSVVLPLKDSYKNLFEKQLGGQTPIKGSNPQPDIKKPSSKEELIKIYEEAEKAGNYTGMVQAQRAIHNLEVKT